MLKAEGHKNPFTLPSQKHTAAVCCTTVFFGAVTLGTIAGIALAIIGATIGMPTLMNAGIITACIAFSPIAIPLLLVLLCCIPGSVIAVTAGFCVKQKVKSNLRLI